MKMTPTPYTHGEVKAILAPILGITAEDIEQFSIIVTGPCKQCGGHDRYNTVESSMPAMQYAEMLREALKMKLDKDQKLS